MKSALLLLVIFIGAATAQTPTEEVEPEPTEEDGHESSEEMMGHGGMGDGDMGHGGMGDGGHYGRGGGSIIVNVAQNVGFGGDSDKEPRRRPSSSEEEEEKFEEE